MQSKHTPLSQYEPFGEEWEKEMMKLQKKEIIEFFKKSQIKKRLLLEALKRAKAYMKEFGCTDQLEFDHIEAAIAKAEGVTEKYIV